MATVFEIAEKLRRGEEVVIPSSYQFIVMQQMSDHPIGDIAVKFEHAGKGCTKLTKV
jgi:hypothetical protein